MSYIGNEPTTVAFLTDTFSGNGSTVAFTMQVAPATTSSILVSVTGVVQDPSTYSVVGTTLTFSQAPPTGTSNISVRYLGIPASGVATTAYRTVTNFTVTAGQTTFSVPSYTVGYIDVFRNGVRLVNNGADFVATNGTTVVLNNACTVGDSVVTESFYVSSVLNAIPATAGAVNTTYLADNSVTTAKIAAGAVVQADLGANVAGNGPAFSAYNNATQSISASTFTKIQLNSEEFDTNNNFDSTTNFRFTPTIAGYYQISGNVNISVTSGTQVISSVFKNGATFKRGAQLSGATYTNNTSSNISCLVFMNGSTDYVELYALANGTSPVIQPGPGDSYFQAAMVRAA